ncbi:inactive dipeptidyl peptidase 10-like [Dendrobates tinctorius]|uniref:inactive dipeptidyl peptidase 10-like n=1 Tax=Dendrobates tinctorius TaxID=92724 RepID=UPI003CC9E40D
MIVSTQQNLGTELDMGSFGAPPRNWRGIGLAVLVIAVVMSIVLLAIFLLSPDIPRQPEKLYLTLSDLENPDYQVHVPNIFWASDTEIIQETQDGNLISQNLETKKTTILLSNITYMSLQMTSAKLSPDLQYLLLISKSQKIAGVSFIASYNVYNIQSRELWNLSPPGRNNTDLQYADWGPHGSQLVFIFENDIYYQEVASGPALRLTSSGSPEKVLNGISDWTYQEEILQSYAAHWWSPDGANLAYLTINSTLVPKMELPHFVGADYPICARYAYPKAGQPIPQVKVFVVNLRGPSHTVEIFRPDTFEYKDYYITLVMWVTNTQLALQWLNRPQNLSLLTICDTTTGACVEKHRTSSDVWIGSQASPVFSVDFTFILVPVKQGGQGEYVHIAMFSTQLGGKENSIQMLTSGEWDVTRIVAYKSDNKTVYFLSTEDNPRTRHLYSVETLGSLNRTCVTCDLIPDCHFVDVEFSPGGSFFTLFCKGPGVPHVSVHQTQNPKDYQMLEDNQPLKTSLLDKDVPETIYRSIHIDDYDLPVRLTVPSGYEDSEYPLIVWLPEAPGTQQVTEEFSLGWQSVLVSSFNIIVAQFDGRGTKNQGLNLLHETDKKLGSVDAKDYIPVVQQLKKLPFVDPNRIGVYGKAYGGFLALKLLSLPVELFACGVTVAPITSFHLHSAVLAERYLGMPSQEGSVYMVASVLNNIQRLRGQRFLLVHGTADANVHFQHTAELLSRLLLAGSNVTSRIYPDEDHFFLSKDSQHHLSLSVVSYLQSCLQSADISQREQ